MCICILDDQFVSFSVTKTTRFPHDICDYKSLQLADLGTNFVNDSWRDQSRYSSYFFISLLQIRKGEKVSKMAFLDASCKKIFEILQKQKNTRVLYMVKN